MCNIYSVARNGITFIKVFNFFTVNACREIFSVVIRVNMPYIVISSNSLAAYCCRVIIQRYRDCRIYAGVGVAGIIAGVAVGACRGCCDVRCVSCSGHEICYDVHMLICRDFRNLLCVVIIEQCRA